MVLHICLIEDDHAMLPIESENSLSIWYYADECLWNETHLRLDGFLVFHKRDSWRNTGILEKQKGTSWGQTVKYLDFECQTEGITKI